MGTKEDWEISSLLTGWLADWPHSRRMQLELQGNVVLSAICKDFNWKIETELTALFLLH